MCKPEFEQFFDQIELERANIHGRVIESQLHISINQMKEIKEKGKYSRKREKSPGNDPIGE